MHTVNLKNAVYIWKLPKVYAGMLGSFLLSFPFTLKCQNCKQKVSSSCFNWQTTKKKKYYSNHVVTWARQLGYSAWSQQVKHPFSHLLLYIITYIVFNYHNLLVLSCSCCQTRKQVQCSDLFTADKWDLLSKSSNNSCDAAVRWLIKSLFYAHEDVLTT